MLGYLMKVQNKLTRLPSLKSIWKSVKFSTPSNMKLQNDFRDLIQENKKIRSDLDILIRENMELQNTIDNFNTKQMELIRLQFVSHAALVRFVNPPEKHARAVSHPSYTQTFEEILISMQEKYSIAFPIWRDLMKAAMDVYLSDPENNLSVSGNIIAEYFTFFVALYIRGRVLDIGCGVASLPIYLQNYPHWAIAGIDPEESEMGHPFLFVKGIGESIPWPNQSFETVIIATSLDHALSLDDTLREVSRVLSSDGKLLIWVGFIPGAKPYDPFSQDLEPIDQYHLFNFDEQWFETLMNKYFICLEKMKINAQSYFYCFTVQTYDLAKN